MQYVFFRLTLLLTVYGSEAASIGLFIHSHMVQYVDIEGRYSSGLRQHGQVCCRLFLK